MKQFKQFEKKFIVTCPKCGKEKEMIFTLTEERLNTLEFKCSNCNRMTYTGPFFLPKGWEKKKKPKKKKKLNLNLPRLGRAKR